MLLWIEEEIQALLWQDKTGLIGIDTTPAKFVSKQTKLYKKILRKHLPHPVAGVRLSALTAGLYHSKRLDMALMEFAPDTISAGVFTQNRMRAAPVILAEEHLLQARSKPRYALINTGFANAGTGADGLDRARLSCSAVAQQAGVHPHHILPFSTGVIGQALPLTKILPVIPKLYKNLHPDRWLRCAGAIRTTDTFTKATSQRLRIANRIITITGMSKGAGMIHPNMATMLAFIATDLKINAGDLRRLLKRACARSFNAISIDGDTSTNDACLLSATGRSGLVWSKLKPKERDAFTQGLSAVMEILAQAIVCDAEGGVRCLAKVVVQGAYSDKDATIFAQTVGQSLLVKTALHGADANWGRILAALGRAPTQRQLNAEQVRIYLGPYCVYSKGQLYPRYKESQGASIFSKNNIEIRLVVGHGKSGAWLWTADLGRGYIDVNAHYRS